MGRFSVRIGTLNRRAFVASGLRGAAGLLMTGAAKFAFGADAIKLLKLGNIPIVNFAPVYRFKAIAKDYGFDVEFVNFPSGTERLNALAAGYIDGSPSGSTQPILLRSKGVPIKIVCDVAHKGKGVMVGGAVRTFADLRGKDIATVRGATTDIWLRQKLIDEGLDPDRDVNLVNMDYLQMGTAVLANRVTAASGAEPQIAAFESKGGRVLSYLTETKLGDIDACLCFLDGFIKKDRGLAKAVVAGMAKSSQDIQRDPDLVPDMMADIVKVDRDVIRRSLKNLTFPIKPDPQALSNLAGILKEMKMIERVPALDEYLDMSLVNEV
jgi:NitT/TauT family transport system substrate-binding protein